MKRIKPLKKILLGIFSFFLLFLAGTQEASAAILTTAAIVVTSIAVGGAILRFFGIGIVSEIAEQIITFLGNVIIFVITAITEVFVAVAGALIKYAIDLNAQVADSSIVREGYNIALSVANIALVIAIITVAFMVMLRRTGAKNLLLRFIAVALIINFGYYIMINLLIRPVDSITFQINEAINVHPEGGFGGTFGSLLREELVPQDKVNEILDEVEEKSGEAGFLFTLAKNLANIIFVGTAYFILIITMFAYVFMLLARYVALSFFIILFPLAVIFWMFPNLKVAGGNLWDQWFQGFTRWLLFAPIGLFFIWLAVKLMTEDPDSKGSVLTTVGGGEAGFFAAVGNMVVVVGFMLGGLIVANKMSITGAGVAQGLVNKAGQYAKGRAKLSGARAGAYLSEKAKKPVEGMQRTPGLRTLGRGLNIAGAKAEQALAKKAKDQIKALAKNPERLAKAIPTLRGARQAEALEILRKKNALHLIPEEAGGIAAVMADPSTRAAFQRLGRNNDLEDLERAIGMDESVAQAARAFDETGSRADEADLQSAVDTFQKRAYQSSKHVDALQTRIFRPGEQYGLGDEARQAVAESLTHGLVDRMPESTVRLRTKATAGEFTNFQGIFDGHMTNFEKTHLDPALRGPGVDEKKKLEHIDANSPIFSAWARRVYPAYNKSLGGLLFAPTTTVTTTTTTTTIPTP